MDLGKRCESINPRTGTQCGWPADHPAYFGHSNGMACESWRDPKPMTDEELSEELLGESA